MEKLRVNKVILLLISAVLLAALYGCGEKANEYTPEGVYLTSVGEQQNKYPQVEGIGNREKTNDSLREYFNAINERLASFNEGEIKLTLSFFMVKTDVNYILYSELQGGSGNKIDLPKIEITDESCVLPAIKPFDILTDNEQLEMLMLLSENGLPISLAELNKPLSVAQFYSILAIYYEHVTGETIDFSSVRRPDITDEFHLKTLKLIPDFPGENSADKLKGSVFIKYFSALRTLLNFKLYGLANQHMNLIDLTNELDLQQKMFGEIAKTYPKMEIWNNLSNDIIAFKNANSVDVINANAVNRVSLSDVFSLLFSKYFSHKEKDISDLVLSDSTDTDALYCVGNELMSEFPGAGMFTGNYNCVYSELQAVSNKFITACFKACFEDETDYKDQITLLQALNCLILADGYYSSYKSVSKDYKKTVVNDRDYTWYARQFDSGEYASVNCMPAMAEMGIKWKNNASQETAEELRNRLLPDYTAGWWLAQLAETLTFYNVEHTLYPVSLSSVVSILDKGGIVLTMFSEAEAKSQGHCELIYGYEKVGDSYRFLVHDPGFGDKYRADGFAYGEARWIDAQYLVWTILRINQIFVSIPA